MGVRAYLSMCFGDPWEGEVPIPQVVEVASRMMALGCTELSLGDTIGVATPGRVVALLDALAAADVPVDAVAVHFHDTYGQALANTLAALQRGVTHGRRERGGLGGCPYAKSATGNLATEDLVWQLHGLGIATGVDLPKLVDTSVWMAEQLGRPSPSRASPRWLGLSAGRSRLDEHGDGDEHPQHLPAQQPRDRGVRGRAARGDDQRGQHGEDVDAERERDPAAPAGPAAGPHHGDARQDSPSPTRLGATAKRVSLVTGALSVITSATASSSAPSPPRPSPSLAQQAGARRAGEPQRDAGSRARRGG